MAGVDWIQGDWTEQELRWIGMTVLWLSRVVYAVAIAQEAGVPQHFTQLALMQARSLLDAKCNTHHRHRHTRTHLHRDWKAWGE
jgi:hypothetical protein